MDQVIKHLTAYAIKGSIDKDNRRIRFVISSSKLDRHNDIVEVQAIANAIKQFSKNAAFLACHMHRLTNGSSPVIGSWITETFKVFKDHSEMVAEFATTALAEEYWNLYSSGHMKAVSIGFVPKEFTDEKDEKQGWIRTYTKIELLEISAVAVGANREALRKEKMKEIFGSDEPKAFVEELVKDVIKKQLDDFMVRFEDQIEEIKILANIDQDGLARLLLELDGNDETSLPRDDEKTAERILKSINNLLKKEA